MQKKIMIIEDEPMIALDIEQAVEDAGCEVAGTAQSVAQALDLLGNAKCDGAILDANLRGESARPVLNWLLENGMSYIVVSGYSREQLGYLDHSAILITKPFDKDLIVSSIRQYLCSE